MKVSHVASAVGGLSVTAVSPSLGLIICVGEPVTEDSAWDSARARGSVLPGSFWGVRRDVAHEVSGLESEIVQRVSAADARCQFAKRFAVAWQASPAHLFAQ